MSTPIQIRATSEGFQTASYMNFHVRSAYRNDAKFPVGKSQRATTHLEDLGVERMIDNDAAVEINYQRLAVQAVESIFDSPDGSMSLNNVSSV